MFVIGSNSASTGYNLTRSLRLRRSATAYLNRTPASATNRQKFTISVWYKAGGISASEVNANILNAGGDGSSVLISGTGAFGGTYQDRLLYREGGTTLLYWPMVFRDPASWYHIVFAMDTTQATAANRTKLYVNGVDQGAFSGTAITQNASTSINNTSAHYINTFNGTFYPSDLYYTEYNFVDGQQLTPSSFGSTNALTGVWQPAAYTGSYGTNGFYLPFTDNSALTTASNVGLGKDFSGNGNYWVTNNISITAGVTYDSMTDVPTLTSATAANFAVLNPLNSFVNGPNATLSNGNLLCSSGIYQAPTLATMQLPTTGKYYWEITVSTVAELAVGINAFASASPSTGNYSTRTVYYRAGGASNSIYIEGTVNAFAAASYTNGDVIAVAYDSTTPSITFYKNNVSQGTYTLTSTANLYPYLVQSAGSGQFVASANFGQRPFTYTPPTGFVALNTYNLPTSTIVKGNTVMDATLWAGNGSTQTITNAAGFQPNLVWIKNRTSGNNHALFDSVRGATKRLYSDSTIAEQTEATTLTAFNSNGFSVSSSGAVNASANNYVGWQWLESASAGFDIVTFTGNGGGQTFAHNLGVAPGLMICKSLNNAQDWYVYHSSIGGTGALSLNTTAATATSVSYWSNVTPGSSTFSVGGNFSSGYTYVNYLFAPIAGFSAFGSYTGNGSADGPFVYTGFKPKFVIIKSTTSVFNWILIDGARNSYNLAGSRLIPNLSDAEGNDNGLDILSNGFKLRSSNGATNQSGSTYIYAAFASNPFKNSLAF